MIILVGSAKGGAGKTTIAVNLAARLALDGRDVLLVDTDVQGSASLWAIARRESGRAPPITTVSKTGKISADLKDLGAKYPYVVVDAAGRDSPELRQALLVCDRLIIPVRPSQFDAWEMDTMARLLADFHHRFDRSVPALAVLNAVSTNRQVGEGDELRKLLADYREFSLFQYAISDRIAFRRAARDGLGVCDLKTADAEKAQFELNRLYREIFDERTS